ncbi:hypothetical protein NKR23_g6777 [Pleurostoma richardsiae]|uniref:Uncharacterized protein n=1 Tax=Pleurostoma richardsiae TaxID=41990 RepID=A0AA38R9Y6_9PEZI|nr:hypothetical protein NKR23_g6777 [Pleurostoma richardsiae]
MFLGAVITSGAFTTDYPTPNVNDIQECATEQNSRAVLLAASVATVHDAATEARDIADASYENQTNLDGYVERFIRRQVDECRQALRGICRTLGLDWDEMLATGRMIEVDLYKQPPIPSFRKDGTDDNAGRDA